MNVININKAGVVFDPRTTTIKDPDIVRHIQTIERKIRNEKNNVHPGRAG